MTIDELIELALSAETDEGRAAIVARPGAPLTAHSVSSLADQVERLLRADPRLAARVAALAVMVADIVAEPLALGLARRAQAHSLRVQGAYGASLAEYEQAVQLFTEAGEMGEAARTRLGQNQSLMFVGRNEEALRVVEEARRVFRARRDRRNLATANLNTGVVYSHLNDHRAALRFFERAYRGYRGLGDTVMAATVDINRGVSLTLLGRFRAALQAYERARPMIAAQGMAALSAMTDANIGYLHFVQGHYAAALSSLLTARQTLVQLDSAADLATVDLDLSEIYLAINQVDEAAALSADALATFDALDMPAEAAHARVNRGLALLLQEHLDPALDLLEEAEDLFANQGNHVGAATAALCRAQALLRRGDSQEAFEVARAAQSVFEASATPVRLGYACVTAGWTAVALDQTDAAQADFEQAMALGERLHHPWLLYQAHYGLGHLCAAQDRALAQAHYLAAVGHLERVRAELQGEDLRLVFLQDKLKVYEDLLLLLLDEGSESSVREAFGIVERARGRALLDLMAGALDVRLRATDPQDAPALERLRALREELNGLYTLLAEDESKLRGGSRVDDDMLRAEVERREAQLERLLRRQHVVQHEPVGLQPAPPIGVAEVQASLAPDTTLVAYYTIRDEILAFVVTSTQVTLYRNLARLSQVTDVAERLRAQMNKFAYGADYVAAHSAHLADSVRHHLTSLFRWLIQPLAALLQGQRLILIPYGVLHYLPFHAFESEGRALMDDYEIVYAPSASVFQMRNRRPPPRHGRPLLVGVSTPNLPHVTQEIAAIAAVLPEADVLLDAAATLEAVRQASPRTTVLHLACHSNFRPESPLFSALWLGNGWLSVHDIYNLELNTELVTLSACNTGLSYIAPGDELLGLARGFFYAGAAAMVASLWAVDDRSTACFMKTFYTYLQTGVSKAAALRATMLEMRSVEPHPYYWAPFILLGEGWALAHGSA